ncbi:MAG: SIMPL domain-containing protein [Pirellulaceae bacterium]
MDAQRYIEVTGEGCFTETASRYVAEVSFEVRAAKKETVLEEVREFWTAAIASLRENGIADSEIAEGGIDYFRPWYWRKKPGQTGTRKIILKVPDFERLNTALEALEPLRSGERRSLTVDLKQPEFDSSSDVKSNALSAAFSDAKTKAETLAQQMGVKLGDVLHVEEGRTARRRSGFSGDDDWYGDGDRFGGYGGAVVLAAGGGAAGDDDDFSPADPTRDIWVKCRVRFSVTSNA